jgi:hypothetical protein
VGNLNRYSGGRGGDRQGYLSLWNCGPVNSIRVNNNGRLSIRKSALVLYGNITPAQLDCLVPRGTEGDGFVPRFCWHLASEWEPTRVVSSEDVVLSMDDPRLAAWHEMLRRLHGVQSPVQLSMTPAADLAWVDQLNDHIEYRFDREMSDDKKSVWSKTRSHAARLLVLLHAWQLASAGEIDPQDIPRWKSIRS